MNSLVLDSLKKKNSMHTKERCRGLRVKNPDREDQINQLSAEERAERDRAKTVVIASSQCRW